MSPHDDTIQALIHQALAALNAERGPQEQIAIGPDTRLFGEESALDSLALVSVIVDLETAVSDCFGRSVSLTDDRAMSQDPVPFTDVGTLQRYIVQMVS